MRDVQRDSTIPFTADNIRTTLDNVFRSRKRLFDESVARVFDELCGHAVENGSGACHGTGGSSAFLLAILPMLAAAQALYQPRELVVVQSQLDDARAALADSVFDDLIVFDWIVCAAHHLERWAPRS